MSLTIENPAGRAPDPESSPVGRATDVATRQGRPVVWFAWMGVVTLSLITYSWTRWIATGNARPVPKGEDKPELWMLIGLHSLEFIAVALVGVAVYFYAWKPYKKTRKVSTDALMILAWWFTYMLLDPWENFTAITYSYNAYHVNLGCPQCFVPFWNSPNRENMGEPLLFLGGMYPGMLFLGTVFSCFAMRKFKKRYPATGTFGLVMVAMVSMFLWDFALEIPPILLGSWVWWWGGGNFTLFDGEYYQQPMLEALTWGAAWGLLGCIRYFKNDKGETFVERGIDRVNVSDRRKTGIKLLAFTGAISWGMAALYMLPYQFYGTHAHKTPDTICDKSYFTTGLAGPGTDYACPDPALPIPLRPDSARITPDGSLFSPTSLSVPPPIK